MTIRYNSKVLKYSTKIKCNPDEWNGKDQSISITKTIHLTEQERIDKSEIVNEQNQKLIDLKKYAEEVVNELNIKKLNTLMMMFEMELI